MSVSISFSAEIFLVLATFAFLLFGPACSVLFRRKVKIEQIVSGDSSTCVILIHGTFSRSARWTKLGHKFLEHIQTTVGQSSIYRLQWSGDNYHKARLVAAEELVAWIQNNCSAAEAIYLIGHSHGGTIAALAATKLEKISVKIITMSTPFIVVQQRHPRVLPAKISYACNKSASDINHQSMEDQFLLLGVILWLCFIGIALYDFGIAFIGLALWWLIWSILDGFGWVQHMMKILEKGVSCLYVYGHNFVANSLIRPAPNSLVILRTPGDEASSILGAFSFVSWFLTFILKLIGRIASLSIRIEVYMEELLNKIGRKISFLIILALATLLFVKALNAWPEKLHNPVATYIALSAVFFLFLRFINLTLAPLLAIATALVNMLLTLPFGFDLAWRSAIVSSTAEPTPLGSWPVRMIASGESLLAHSALYESENIPYILSDLSGVCPGFLNTRDSA